MWLYILANRILLHRRGKRRRLRSHISCLQHRAVIVARHHHRFIPSLIKRRAPVTIPVIASVTSVSIWRPSRSERRMFCRMIASWKSLSHWWINPWPIVSKWRFSFWPVMKLPLPNWAVSEMVISFTKRWFSLSTRTEGSNGTFSMHRRTTSSIPSKHISVRRLVSRPKVSVGWSITSVSIVSIISKIPSSVRSAKVPWSGQVSSEVSRWTRWSIKFPLWWQRIVSKIPISERRPRLISRSILRRCPTTEIPVFSSTTRTWL
mmetsp:Transcript_13246/g.31792  ORF Transcript_13246/g.31792 Transcript_13246/m.31792 type:complete len:262 (+) Transcript_13246:4089-4874(+)